MKFIFIFVIAILSVYHATAQTNEIDSLQRALGSYAKEDTTKVKLFNDIAMTKMWYEFQKQDGSYSKDTILLILEQALSLAEKIKDNKGIAMSLGNTAQIYNILDDLKATEYLEKALKVFEEINDEKAKAILLWDFAEFYSDRVKKIDYLKKSLKIFEKIGDKYRVAIIISKIAKTYNQNNQPEESLKYYQLALNKWKEEKYGEKDSENRYLGDIIRLFYEVIDLCNKLGKKSLALEYELSLFNMTKAIKDEKRLLIILPEIARNYIRQGKVGLALEYLFELLSLQEKHKLNLEATYTLNTIAEIYTEQEYYEKSVQHLQKAIKYMTGIDDEYGYIMDIYNSIGFNLTKMGKFSEAMQYHFKVKTTVEERKFKKINDIMNLAGSLDGIGQAYMGQGNYQKALEYFFKASEYFTQTTPFNNNFIYLYIAQCYQKLGNREESLKYGLKVSESMSGMIIMVDIRMKKQFLISEIYAQLGQYQQAYQYNLKGVLLKDSVAKVISANRIADFEFQSAIQKDKNQITKLENDKKLQSEENKNQKLWLFSASGAFLSAILLAFVLYRNNQNKQKANQLLAEQKEELAQTNDTLNHAFKEIEKKNEDITASITYAKRIQTAMLPRIEDIQKALPKSFILFKPRDIVSGDFYYFKEISPTQTLRNVAPPKGEGLKTPLPAGGGAGGGAKIILACADCTGHGVPGAFMSMIGNEILTNIVEIQGITSPDLILNELHKNIRAALKQGETENRDGMDISIVTIEKEIVREDSDNGNEDSDKGNISPLFVSSQTTKITYAGAMNPIYYVQNGELHEIKADKLPIGGSQKEQERAFTKHTIELGVRSYELGVGKEQPQTPNSKLQTVFYLCSDGFQDQFGGAQGKKFMVKKFRELLFSIHHLPMHEQRQILDDTIESWMAEGKEHQIDDILVMGIQV